MSRTERIAITGGSGRLGSELLKLRPDWIPLNRPAFDLLQQETIESALDEAAPTALIHAAAYTDVAGAERNRDLAWKVNAEGTLRLVRSLLKRDIFMIYISTDYVFEGIRGGYRETDPLGPPMNYYALTKLVAETVVRTLPKFLILRTSFRPRDWPYPVAFEDLFTSQDYVDRIAPDIALAVERREDIPYDTIHIATERKSAYELARRRRPDVLPGSKSEASVQLPDDISLDISRWMALRREWGLK